MTTRKILAGFMVAAIFWGAGPALAQNSARRGGQTGAPSEEQAARADSDMAIPEIEVRGAVRRDELKSTSATVLENKDIVDRKYVQPLDMMKMSPGTNIVQYGQSGVAPDAYIRGLQGSHGGQIGMYLDGIPLNDSGHNDNYIDSNVIIPIEIESLEIIKGPQSVYYGNGSAAGAMAFQSYKTGDFTRMSLRYGSYNDADVQGIIAKTDDKLSHVYAFQVYHTDGWADNSDWDRYNVSGRWTYQFTDQFSASLNVRAYKSDWNSAGYLSSLRNLPDTAWVDDGSGEGNGGQRRRFDARLWANYLLNDESQLTFYTFATDLDNTRWGIDFPDAYYFDFFNTEQTNTRRAYGVGAAYNFKGELGSRETNFTVGLDYLREKATQEKYQLNWGDGRKRGVQSEDYDFVLNTVSLFGEASYQVLDPLQVRLGARYDHFTGSRNNGPKDADPNQHYNAPGANAFSPKAGLLLTPLDWLDVYANYGRGSKLSGLSNGDFFKEDPPMTKFDQYELGYRLRPTDWIDLEMTYYFVNQFNEEIAMLTAAGTPTGEYTYAGKTERSGLETSVSLRPWESWSLTANYTYQKAVYKEMIGNLDEWWNYSAGLAYDYAGRRMAFVPKHIANLKLAYAPDQGFGGRLNFRWEADIMLKDQPAYALDGSPYPYNNRQSKGQNQGALDLQLSYKFDEKYKLFLDVLNLTDRRNYGFQGATADNGYYSYSIQPPRTFYLGLDVNWD
jgi:iron complex outermembrane receptor protein